MSGPLVAEARHRVERRPRRTARRLAEIRGKTVYEYLVRWATNGASGPDEGAEYVKSYTAEDATSSVARRMEMSGHDVGLCVAATTDENGRWVETEWADDPVL